MPTIELIPTQWKVKCPYCETEIIIYDGHEHIVLCKECKHDFNTMTKLEMYDNRIRNIIFENWNKWIRWVLYSRLDEKDIKYTKDNYKSRVQFENVCSSIRECVILIDDNMCYINFEKIVENWK